ncbi:proteasome accessory factor PafA2 [Mangrovactinospora gilvigrisea]|uniref:Proteasome accessory factor PafA2 n=1 Tax=Mangrovactinospora gilvigrisea TaxID=1428644 RepID=A0A1J7BIC4_9ACTN|nr:depupylase/deamidase Dop [Mangrovactinospora gilvigrisea]OIV38411.1 proteasome accessory factor PafA2 [Mangrovactinospora gilvigrisea]
MTVRRVMGIETEYGISVPGHPNANAMLSSSQIVNAYAAAMQRARRARWDFEEENPLRDARGFDLARDAADASQLTDEDIGLANVILTNGARLYVDHAHPEYSAPETTNPRDALLWDKAGERVMAEAALRAAEVPGASPLHLYKNNTDNKGASYGCHENYLMARATPFSDIVRHLTPFFVSRQVVTGAGRVGIGQDGQEHGFQISQRADYFEVEVGLETTLKRPIINTRDEPHADAEKYRRLHVIIGDANLSEVSTYLKLGTTSLVLAMIEDGFISIDLAVDQPVRTLHQVSHDPTLQHLVRLRSGRKLTAVQLQMEYCELARKYVEDRYGVDADEQTRDVLTRWEDVLNRLENNPESLSRELDWVAKKQLLDGYRRRDGVDWDAPTLHLVDLQYSDVRPEKGVYNRLVAKGRFERLLEEDEIRRAMTAPPEDTRAYFRGRCLEQYAEHVAAASWDSVIFDLPGRDSLQRVPTLEPLRGTRNHVKALLDRCRTAEDLVRVLSGGG